VQVEENFAGVGESGQGAKSTQGIFRLFDHVLQVTGVEVDIHAAGHQAPQQHVFEADQVSDSGHYSGRGAARI
jgi:hypothetical protein